MELHIYNKIINALQPLVEVANTYASLDKEKHGRILIQELDGNTITLSDCMVAREVSNNLKKLIGVA